MEKVLDRSEVKKENQWDLERIYQNVDYWQEDYDKCKSLLDELLDLKEHFLDDSKHFKDFILLDDKLERLLEKVYVYASLKNNEDLTNPQYQELIGKSLNLYQEIGEKTNFVRPAILKEDKNKILGFIDEEKELEPFRYTIMTLLRYKDHSLSEKEEKIISAYATVLDSASKTFDMLRGADMRFGNILDEEGREVELTESSYSIFLRSHDRNVRKNAFLQLYKVYEGFKNTLNSTLEAVVNNHSTTARLRNFNSSLELGLFGDNIPTTLYKNLIDSVHNHLDSLYKYYDIKKKLLGVDEYHLYDVYVSVVPGINKKYSFEEGRDLVINALSVLGDDYINILKTAFTDGWIDRYPNRGKSSGAFSSGSYDTLPYVLLNYTETYNDVSTLAHELGHSMHTYLSNQNNDYVNARYSIFLAEIASTVNELLFSYYMEKHSTDKKEKLAILNERLDLFKATIYRQVMFGEFELFIHEEVDKGNILIADKLSDYYYELNKTYFGDGVSVDREIRYEWLRIPHFYSPFYVYKYATGLSIASYIVKNILDGTEGFTDKYLEFLKSGSSDDPLEILKVIDVDLSDTKVFDDALEMFDDTINSFINSKD